MQRQIKIFLAIIFGATIIGVCVYFALKGGDNPYFLWSQKTQTKSAVAMEKQTKISVKPDLVQNVTVSSTACGAVSNTIVTKVIDGDTVVVEGGWHVRLLGMDADEKDYPCYDPARARLEYLVLAKQGSPVGLRPRVTLEKDVSDVDQYGRCLRYIFLGTTNIDTQLVKEGLAVARFYAPDVKYRSEITTAEQQAQANGIGCKWSGSPQAAK